MNTYQLRFSCTATELYSGDATVKAKSLEEAKGKLEKYYLQEVVILRMSNVCMIVMEKPVMILLMLITLRK